MPKDRQSSWAAGELTPDLYTRGGIDGAELLKNFMVTPQGAIINRPGSEHLATLGAQTARLVPFLFGGDDPRLVEIYGPGNVAMRDPSGALVSTGTLPDDTTGDTVSPSRAAVLDALRRIRVAQCAGTLMLGTSPMKDLKRTDATHYTAPAQVSLFPPFFGSSANPFSTASSKTAPAVQTSDATYTIKAVGGDANHPPREWSYAVTRVVAIASGDPNKPDQVIETLPTNTTVVILGGRSIRAPGGIAATVDQFGTYNLTALPKEIAVYGDWLQRIDVGGAAGDPWTETSSVGARAGVIVSHRVYRGRGGIFGYLGETTERHFVDDGRDPDPANPPPLGNDPFNRVTPPNDWPVAVAFMADRRFGGGSPKYPQRIWGSAVGDWSDFDEVITPDDADALLFDLGSNTHEEIRHLLSSQAMLAFTGLKTWAVAGSGNLEVLTPTSIAARPVEPIGSAHYPAPLATDGGVVFFVDAKGGHPYALTTDGNGAAQITDLTLFSPHFFEGHTIVDWAWARDPYKTLWAVRDDGILLSLCYAPGFQVQAWTQHAITGGLVEAVATLPIGREDLLYMVVNRDGGLHLERLMARAVTDARYAVHLDMATVDDGSRQEQLVISSIFFDGINPYVVHATVTGGDFSDLVVNTVLQLPDTNGRPVIGTITSADGFGSIQITVTSFQGDVLQLASPATIAEGQWGIAKNVVTGSALVNGTTVTAVIDGMVFPGLVAAPGSVQLPMYGLVRIVGLPFVSQMRTLRVEQERSRQKSVTHVNVELGISRGGSAGADFDHLVELPPRSVADGYAVNPLRADDVLTSVPSQFDKKARVCIQQGQPTPIKIVGIEREYTLGG